MSVAVAVSTVGCGAGDIAWGPEVGTLVGARLTSGSCPGGEIVEGSVPLPPANPPGGGGSVRVLGGLLDYVPAVGAVVELERANNTVAVARTDELGRFRIENTDPGTRIIRISLGQAVNSTDIEVQSKGGQRVSLVAAPVVPSGVSVRRTRIDLWAPSQTVQAGNTLRITAAVDGTGLTEPMLAWVLHTRTGASLEPTGSPNVVKLVAGQYPGRAELRAHLPGVKSNRMVINILGGGVQGGQPPM